MLSDPFCVVFVVCVWIIVRLEDPNMAYYRYARYTGTGKVTVYIIFQKVR